MEKDEILSKKNATSLFKGAALLGSLIYIRKLVRAAKKISVKDKVVFITGGSRGLGLVMARHLTEAKARVVICARDEEELKKAGKQLSAKLHVTKVCDITSLEQVGRVIREVEEKWGPIDILINNAGVIQTGPMDNMDKNDYEQAMKTHFWGPYHTIMAVLPSMKARKAGNIVNVVSIGGKVSFPHLLPYNASKYALSGLSEGITAELSHENIKVTTIYPGLMRTGSPRNIDVKGQHDKEYAWFKIADSLPFLSIDAEKAASKIIDAFRAGDKTCVLTFPAKLAMAIHGIAPGLNITLFDLINSALPDASPNGNETRKGYESESKASNSAITNKTEKAAARNNEL